MSYDTKVTITVQVDGEKVAKRKVRRAVGNVESGTVLLQEVQAAAADIARELKDRAGV